MMTSDTITQFLLILLIEYKKMWYECQLDYSPSKSQFIKVNYYRSKYGCLQHIALAHTEAQAIKDPKNE